MSIDILNQTQYKYICRIQNVDSGIILDLGNAGVIESITWNTSLDFAQAGKFEIIIKGDAVGRDIIVNEGDFIAVGVNEKLFFLGRVWKLELNVPANEPITYTITAFDHLTLLAGEESLLRPNGVTASNFFTMIMQRFVERGLRGRVVEHSRAPLDSFYFTNETLYTMIRESMTDTHIKEQGENIYCVYDNLGTIEFNSLNNLKTPYIIGDSSFTESYIYGVNITESANVIKILRPNKEIGMYESFIKFDSDNIRRWGFKSYVMEIEDGYTDAQAREMLDILIETKNRPQRTLDVTCVGINGIRAGSGIQFVAQRGQFDHSLWVESCEHIYGSDRHIMNLSLFL